MRKGERVKLNEKVTEQVMKYVGNIPSSKALDFYVTSYLPIISDCLTSIADSLEILTKDKEKPQMLPKTLFCENCGITETNPSFGQQYCCYCGAELEELEEKEK